MSAVPTAFHRPLVFRIAAMGDAVLLVPMLQALRQRYGQPCDVISSGPWTPQVLGVSPHVHEIRMLTSRRTPYLFNRSQRELVRWLRARPAGPVYLCEDDDKTHWLLARGGIKREWLCSARDIPPRFEKEHQIDHELRLARLTPEALGGQPISEFPGPTPSHALTAPPEALADCDQWLHARGLAGRRLVLVQPGNKRTMRRGSHQRATNVRYWPNENWSQLISGIRKTMPDAAVLVCGSPTENEFVESIVVACGDPDVINAASDLPIPRLMGLLTRAHSMVSNNTGPAHLATAIGCPLVVLFESDQYWRYFNRPTTAPVRIVAPPPPVTDADRTIAHPMTRIEASTVIEAWTSIVANLPARPA